MKEKISLLLSKIKYAYKYSIHSWIFKCFAIAFLMEIVLEMLGRRSVFAGFSFMITSPIVFIYNVSIIFFTFLFALFLRKRIFGLIIIGAIWLGCGIVNFIVLGFRVTPFAAIDFLMLKDTISMIDIYYTKFQQIIIVVVLIIAIVGIVFLFKKTPRFEGRRNVISIMALCIFAWIAVLGLTNFGVAHNVISDDFANLGTAYKDYGFAYCFTNSIVDNGVSEPENYSEESMNEIKQELDLIKPEGKEKKPNVVFIQLESFFDPKGVKGLELESDPVPNFTKYKEMYPSGYLTVPALGAGTANSEFEVLTAIKSSYFGAGEYPYKTTVNSVPVEGICSVLKNEGYGAYAIHNNRSSFYDRKNVYEQMGFDAFISLEYMYDIEKTSTGWAKDYTLVNDIMKCLKDTKQTDLVYTISVQGHGRYPTEPGGYDEHVKLTYDVPEVEEQFRYYVNQIYEMDEMIGNLVNELDEYGEDYVLVLYGDHLPTLDITEEQLPDSTLFQTEYVIINNIDIKMGDEDIEANQLSVKVLNALNMPLSYPEKAHLAYSGNELDEKLTLITYDMLFGKKYLYDGNNAVDENVMKMGVSDILITNVKNEEEHVVISGDMYNTFSHVYVNDDEKDTMYIDENTLIIQDYLLSPGDEITVKQVDKSHHILSSTDVYVYSE